MKTLLVKDIVYNEYSTKVLTYNEISSGEVHMLTTHMRTVLIFLNVSLIKTMKPVLIRKFVASSLKLSIPPHTSLFQPKPRAHAFWDHSVGPRRLVIQNSRFGAIFRFKQN